MLHRLKTRLLALLILAAVLSVPFAILLSFSVETLLSFLFLYPLCMSVLWTTGGLYYWWHWERRWQHAGQPAGRHDIATAASNTGANRATDAPLVSLLVPCHNEAAHVEETLLATLGQRYPNLEIIAINDGSSDETGVLLDRLAQDHERLHVVHLAHNQGKAMALRMGALVARSDYLVCIDGDTVLDVNAVGYLVAPLLQHPRVGAVTGNPRVRTRSTILGRIQVGEFSSIIGLIKRTQRVYGQVFTVSGVIAAFRRAALDRVGYWDLDMITEDIDISWKLQRDHWSIFYEPRALCWALMPETLNGLWRQRLRWAQGGAEVFLKNLGGLWRWRHRRLWPLALEYCLSITWAYGLALAILLWLASHTTWVPRELHIASILPGFTGMVLAAACLVQFAVSVIIDRRYEPALPRVLVWVIWYPLVYWLLSLATSLVSFAKVMLRNTHQRRARWVSPDRGVQSL